MDAGRSSPPWSSLWSSLEILRMTGDWWLYRSRASNSLFCFWVSGTSPSLWDSLFLAVRRETAATGTVLLIHDISYLFWQVLFCESFSTHYSILSNSCSLILSRDWFTLVDWSSEFHIGFASSLFTPYLIQKIDWIELNRCFESEFYCLTLRNFVLGSPYLNDCECFVHCSPVMNGCSGTVHLFPLMNEFDGTVHLLFLMIGDYDAILPL